MEESDPPYLSWKVHENNNYYYYSLYFVKTNQNLRKKLRVQQKQILEIFDSKFKTRTLHENTQQQTITFKEHKVLFL